MVNAMAFKLRGWLSSQQSSRMLGSLAIASVVAFAACGTRTGAPAQTSTQSLADLYSGKTVTIIVGYAPGGGFDTTARIAAKYLGKHIPGSPNVIVDNMPGAGSLTAANHIYNVAKPDGLTIGVFNETQVLNQVASVE